jgi:ribonuclease D
MADTGSGKKRKRTLCRNDSRNRFENDSLDQSLPFFFDIPLSCRILVQSAAHLDLFDSVVSDAHILGIDTETRPSLYNNGGRGGKNKTALLQICTRSERGNEMVFIVDLISIAKESLLPAFDRMLAPVMGDENVIKLGHGLIYDFKELRESYPDMKAFYNVENIYDTAKMHRKLRPHEKNSISLKKLTKMFLHLNLIKSQTCSDWEIRPLSESQLHYCACDALVLLRLYDAMTFEAMDLFGDSGFEDIICSIVSNNTITAEEKKNIEKSCIVLEDISSRGSPVESDDTDAEVVGETSLSAAGKYLYSDFTTTEKCDTWVDFS